VQRWIGRKRKAQVRVAVIEDGSPPMEEVRILAGNGQNQA